MHHTPNFHMVRSSNWPYTFFGGIGIISLPFCYRNIVTMATREMCYNSGRSVYFDFICSTYVPCNNVYHCITSLLWKHCYHVNEITLLYESILSSYLTCVTCNNMYRWSPWLPWEHCCHDKEFCNNSAI